MKLMNIQLILKKKNWISQLTINLVNLFSDGVLVRSGVCQKGVEPARIFTSGEKKGPPKRFTFSFQQTLKSSLLQQHIKEKNLT